MVQKIRKAVFPVGGLGTRFLPATKAMPKEMLPVVDKPLIQYAVEEAIAAGIEELIFVTGRGKTAIEDHFDRSFELEETLRMRELDFDYTRLGIPKLSPGSITYIRQQEPLGLGHAVWCARHLIREEAFAVLLADDFIHSQEPCLKQMIETYQGGILTAVIEVERDQVDRYGIIDIESAQGNFLKVKGVIEKPSPNKSPSQTAIVGRYILDAHIFNYLESQLKGVNGEIQLTDAMAELIGQIPFYALRFKGKRYDCGTKKGLLLASVDMALQQQAKIGEITNEIENLLIGYQTGKNK